jgi:hypothetical protein
MEVLNPILSTWAINSSPATNTVATVSRASQAGQRNVLTGFCATFSNLGNAASGTGTVNIRDGATGAGTLLWTFDFGLSATVGSTQFVALGDLRIVGTVATAMTIEFTAAGGAGTSEKVNICGFSIV